MDQISKQAHKQENEKSKVKNFLVVLMNFVLVKKTRRLNYQRL